MGEYERFELAILYALVNLGVEDGRRGGVVKVAFSQDVNLGTRVRGNSKGIERNASAGWGGGHITSLGRRRHKVDELGGVRAMAWVYNVLIYVHIFRKLHRIT